MITTILQIFLAGLIVLAGAILLNSVAQFLQLQSWYEFLDSRTTTPLSALWLFFIYPMGLGLLVFFAKKLLNL